MTTTLPEHTYQLREAATTIRRAVTDNRRVTNRDLVSAHHALRTLRNNTTGQLRSAIDHYLADNTWHHGPLPLLAAIHNLCHQLQLPSPESAIAEQPRLFQ